MLEFCPGAPFGGTNGRTFALPLIDQLASPTSSVIPPVVIFQIRERDVLDFSIDATQWLAANGNGVLAAGSAWAVAVGSPMTPTIVGQQFDPSGLVTAVIAPMMGANVGDVYWLDVTLAVAPAQLTMFPNVQVPARKLTRRVYIQVVAG